MKSLILTVATIVFSTVAFSQTNTTVKRKELTKTAIPIQKETKIIQLSTSSFDKKRDNKKNITTQQVAARPKQNKK